MALIEVQTVDGPRKVRVCDYCRTVCIPSGRFCSGTCRRKFEEFYEQPKRVFTNCNVCGDKLRTADEDKMGMCERCANE